MKNQLRIVWLVAVSAMMILTSLFPANAAPTDLINAEIPQTTPVQNTVPQVTYGEVQSIPFSEVSGSDASRSTAAAVRCNQQKVVVSYPEAKFTGIKKWCYDGRRVTEGTMAVQATVVPEHRYTETRDGWVYVPEALKKTDRFVTLSGVERAAHRSVRTGRFEYRVHGQERPQIVYIPSVSRTGYGDGDCRGPKPTDLAPRIVGVAPSPGQTGFIRGGNIVARLNMEAREGTSNESTFYAQNSRTGEYVEGATGRYGPDPTMIIIVPDKPLDASTGYTVTIAAGPYGVLGKTGDPLQGGKTWTFKTGTKIANG